MRPASNKEPCLKRTASPGWFCWRDRANTEGIMSEEARIIDKPDDDRHDWGHATIRCRMTKLPTKLWWIWAPLVFTAQIYAQSNWADKSPHKAGFITANGVRLHYLDWGGAGDTLLFL